MQVETVAGRSSTELDVARTQAEIAAGLREGISSLRRFALLEAHDWGATVTARPNFWAWGARIELQFVPAGPSATFVTMRWTPSLPTTIYTWGQGARDLNAIAAVLTA